MGVGGRGQGSWAQMGSEEALQACYVYIISLSSLVPQFPHQQNGDSNILASDTVWVRWDSVQSHRRRAGHRESTL